MYNSEQRPSDLVKDQLPDVDLTDPAPSAAPTEDEVLEAMKDVVDPELMVNVVDLGLVYSAEVKPSPEQAGKRLVEVRMTLTAPGCGMGEILVDDVRSKLELIPTVAEADVELVFDPPWTREMMSEAARLETGMF